MTAPRLILVPLLLVPLLLVSCAADGVPAERDLAPPAGALASSPQPGPGSRSFPPVALPPREGPREPSLRARVEGARLTGFEVREEESLRAVMAAIAAASGLPIVVDPRAEQAARAAGAVFDLSLAHSIAVADLIGLLVERAGEDVGWTIRHGVLLVTTRERARGPMTFAMHDVRDLTVAIPDFAGPRLGRLHPEQDAYYDDADAGAGGLIGRHARFEEEDLLELVRENVEPDSWDAPGASLEARNGLLLARNTGEVQESVRRFLARLR